MSVVRHVLEEKAFRIIASLEPPHFVSCRDKLLGELDHSRIRPNGPPARYSVVSCTAKWVTVHGPEQKRQLALISIKNAFFKRRQPRNRLPAQI